MNISENPLFTQTYNKYRQRVITVNVVVKEGDERAIDLAPGRPFYDDIVDTIISNVYPDSKMQAIINNYLLDPSNPDTLAEFNDMQDFRKKAKAIAKEILSSLEK